jgi:hypothetical protein
MGHRPRKSRPDCEHVGRSMGFWKEQKRSWKWPRLSLEPYAYNSEVVQVSVGIRSLYFEEYFLDGHALNVLDTNNIGSLPGTFLEEGLSANSGTDIAKYRTRAQTASCTVFGAPAIGLKAGLRDGLICGSSKTGSCALAFPNALRKEIQCRK